MSCQWSQRTLITRLLKGLESSIEVHIAHDPRLEGYAINGGHSWRVPGSKKNIEHLHQLYQISDPAYTGSATVPVLWHSVEQRIVSNESAKIQRAFDAVIPESNAPGFSFNLAPISMLAEINQLNEEFYTNLSNAVYLAGFAQSQSAYDQAVEVVFA
jgi:putative glutathione S-transferase